MAFSLPMSTGAQRWELCTTRRTLFANNAQNVMFPFSIAVGNLYAMLLCCRSSFLSCFLREVSYLVQIDVQMDEGSTDPLIFFFDRCCVCREVFFPLF